MKPTVGLTGGIACGKSTVASIFHELGIPIVDADQIAREVVAPGSEGLDEIVKAFGDEVLQADGALDRKALGRVVFADAAKRKQLEAITHPRIAQAGMAALAALGASTDAPYLIYEAALLVESGAHRMFPALVVVAVSPAVQLARLVARDGDPQDARARIASQMPMEEKVAAATHVIWNDGDHAALRVRVAEVHEALTRMLNGGTP